MGTIGVDSITELIGERRKCMQDHIQQRVHIPKYIKNLYKPIRKKEGNPVEKWAKDPEIPRGPLALSFKFLLYSHLSVRPP